MKVYMGARYARRHELRVYSSQGNGVGVENVGRWIYFDLPQDADTHALAKEAQRDWDDVVKAEAFVLFTEDAEPADAPSKGGMHVELGIALAHRKRIIIVGPPGNLYHHLGGIKQFATWAQALEFLRPKSEYEEAGFFDNIQKL